MKYKVSVIKKIAFLVMTMALAVAMVACSGATGVTGEPGPAGPAGPAGTTDPTTPTEPVDPPEPEPGPVQKAKDIPNLIFNDTKDGMDTMPQSIDVSEYFHPSGLTYSLNLLSTVQSKRIDAMLDDNNMLTVMLKASNSFQNDMLTVKATDGSSSLSLSFYVRRNQAPKVVPIGADLAADARANPVDVWVLTQDETIVMAKDPGTLKDIRVALGRDPATDGSTPSFVSREAFFQDDLGNKLTFISEVLSTSDSKKLMVTGGNMQVTLIGLETTEAIEERAIEVHLLANDGHFISSDSAHVLNVKVDTPPVLDKEASAIPTQVINVGEESTSIAIGDPTDTILRELRDMFKDDRQRPNLEFYAWSADDTIAEVVGNPTNKKNGEVAAAGLLIRGLKVGETTIMVKAKEPTMEADPEFDNAATNANEGQVSSDVLVINVTVRLDPNPTP